MAKESTPSKITSKQFSLAEFDALFRNIGEGLIVTNELGVITRINKRALEIFGYMEKEVIGKRFTDVIRTIYENGVQMDILESPIANAYLTGKLTNSRTYYLRKDGTPTTLQTTISPLIIKSKPMGTVQLFRDISDEQEMDKLKSDFISLASHQLRTPLSSVNIYAGMLLNGMAGDINTRQKRFIETILKSTRRMNELINTLLNISRIEAGGVMVNPEVLNINSILKETLSDLDSEIQKKKLNLKMDIGPITHSIKSDQLLVKEVLSNLVSNAIKYTPELGEIKITLKEDSNNIIITVEDSGYGIPKKYHDKVFSKFFRADNILIHDVSGTGLGLYLTKTIVDNLSGDLWFISEENKGTCFFFSLPKHGSVAKKGSYKLGEI